MAPGPALYFYNHGNFQDHTHEKAKLRQKKRKGLGMKYGMEQ